MATAQTMASQSSTSIASARAIRFQAGWASTEPEIEGTRGAFMSE
ncbi:hypothetical protein CFII64_06415 [Pseudomonas sp. CFII64]|nr:hypothetical protein CFII64_06415 [Pseudomonas sp. CFII64]